MQKALNVYEISCIEDCMLHEWLMHPKIISNMIEEQGYEQAFKILGY